MKDNSTLYTAGKLAAALGVSDSKVKKLIKELDIQPTEKKGACNYYSQDNLEKLKQALDQIK